MDGAGSVCPANRKTSRLAATELITQKPHCSLMRTLTTSTTHCSVMSGDRHQPGWTSVGGGGLIGSCGHHVSANSKVKHQRGSIVCCCTFTLSNGELSSGRIVYLYRWRRGAPPVERLSGIDEGADGLWPLASLCSADRKLKRERKHQKAHVRRAASSFTFTGAALDPSGHAPLLLELIRGEHVSWGTHPEAAY